MLVSQVPLGGRVYEGSVVSQTRPNNTTAYIIGDVIGDGTDARWVFPLPANVLGADGAQLRYTLYAPNNGANLTLGMLLFTAAPTAVGDNSGLSMTQAEQFSLLRGGGAVSAGVNTITHLTFTSNSSQQMLNESAGTLGRRVVGATAAFYLPSGVTQLWGYLYTNAAFTPLALEKYEIIPGYMPWKN